MPDVLRRPLAAVLAFLLVPGHAPGALAGLEEVLVTHAGTDDAVIERASGECWWLDMRQDCFGIRDYKGRWVLLWSPTPEVTTRSRLLIPERGISCPIWQADTTNRAAVPAYSGDVPGAGLRAVRRALDLLGYGGEPGPPGWTPRAALALRRFREARGLDTSPDGLRRALAALALEVVRGPRDTPAARRLARTIADHGGAVVTYLSRAGDGARPHDAPTSIRAVAADGSVVSLADGTRWLPAVQARALVSHWRAGDEAMACGDRLVNGRTGDLAQAERVR